MRVRVDGSKSVQSDLLGTYQNGSSVSKIYAPPHYGNYSKCVDELHPGPPYSSGGPLYIQKYNSTFKDYGLKTGYDGPYGPGVVIDCNRRVYSASIQGYVSDTDAAVRLLGASAWKKFRPKLTKLDLGQSIAELRDIPSLFKRGMRHFMDLGDEYLKYQFGWKPFVKDFVKSLDVYRDIDHRLAVAQKHNYKWLRRGGDVSMDHSDTYDSYAIVTPSNYLTEVVKGRRVVATEKVWFKGAFRYYIPGLSNGNWGRLRFSRKLFGLELTPTLAYNLTPWSWLADWFGNVGDVIDNYTSISQENMCAKYAYVMRHRKSQITCEASFKGRFSPWLKPTIYESGWASSVVTAESLVRSQADPFGFDIYFADFTQFQLSILGALGLSRFK